jgi:hypothetical protein
MQFYPFPGVLWNLYPTNRGSQNLKKMTFLAHKVIDVVSELLGSGSTPAFHLHTGRFFLLGRKKRDEHKQREKGGQ